MTSAKFYPKLMSPREFQERSQGIFEKVLVQACLKAGRHIRRHAYDYKLEWKSKDDPVTNLDKKAERILREDITEYFGGDISFVGEEEGNDGRDTIYRAIIDPIDGTKSFIRREYYSALSLGFEHQSQLIGGVVYDFMKDIAYVAIGDRAYALYHGKEMPLYRAHGLSKLHLAVDDQGLRHPETLKKHPRIKFKEERGSFALTLAQLVQGTYDGAVFSKQGKGKIWDVAGGTYLTQQQGYHISNIEGGNFDYKNPNKGFIAVRKGPELETVLKLIEQAR